jgi:hypothetical protein
MKIAKDAIYDILSGDTTLKSYLAANSPFYNSEGTKTTANSIIPAGKATTATLTPFITIQGGPRSKVDPLGNAFDEFFYIRCYNDNKKTFVEIDNIIQRIEQLIDGVEITLSGDSCVLATLEDVGAELEDEALELNFKEARFRVRLI